MARNQIPAQSPISSGIRDFITFCRMEKGLSRNSLEAYGRDLEDLRAFKREGALLLMATKPDLRTPAPGYTIY